MKNSKLLYCAHIDAFQDSRHRYEYHLSKALEIVEVNISDVINVLTHKYIFLQQLVYTKVGNSMFSNIFFV